MNVGNYIKELRKSKGLTQEELGVLVGVQRAAVQKWESGMTQNLKRITIQTLADYFNVSPASFFDTKSTSNNDNIFENMDYNERQIIQNYRNLSDQGKEYILQTMDMAVMKYKKDNSVSENNKEIV